MKDIPDLQSTAGKLEMISESQEHLENSLDDAKEVMEIAETNVSHQEFSNGPSTPVHDSDFRKYSQNSLKGVVGVALEQSKQDEAVQPNRSEQEHDIFCKSGEESQNSWVEQNR